MATDSEFPRSTNSLLTQDEKNFLDDLPDEGVVYLMSCPPDAHMKASFISNDLERSFYYEFKDERNQAVKDYYEMLFHFGVRKDPRVA